ncbi:MAG: hypothetical protein QXH26_00025 [Candidatus Hadarchaeales archaeon]
MAKKAARARAEPARAKSPSISERLKEFSAELERMKARIDALSAMRELFDTRFGQLSEKIGEVRSLALAAERELGEARRRAEQTFSLVEQIKPETYLSEMKRREAEVSLLRGRLETIETQIRELRRELADFRGLATTFKGLKGLNELAREVSSELMEVKRTKAEVERHSDKVATMFFEVQRALRDFAKLNLRLERLDDTSRQLAKSVSSLEVKLGEFATKKEMGEILQTFEALKSLAPNLEELGKKYEELSKLKPGEGAEGVASLERRIEALEGALKEMDVEEFSRRASEAQRVLREVGPLLERLEELSRRAERLNELEKKLEKVEKLSLPEGAQRMMDEVSERVESLTSLLKTLNEKMVERADLEKLEERMDRIESELEEVRAGKGGVGAEELRALEERVDKLEELERKTAEAMLALDKRVDALEGAPTPRPGGKKKPLK